MVFIQKEVKECSHVISNFPNKKNENDSSTISSLSNFYYHNSGLATNASAEPGPKQRYNKLL